MIYTITLNPSIDYVVHVKQMELGKLNKMSSDLKLPGGKGINVSRILQELNVNSTALGFLGALPEILSPIGYKKTIFSQILSEFMMIQELILS